MFPFDPPKNITKPKVFWCFQGDQKGTYGKKGLTYLGPVFPLYRGYIEGLALMFCKKVFWEISQNPQENTCARAFFKQSCRP